jgi:hypothetical protein
MGWLNMYLPMSLFSISEGQGSGTTVAIPINENKKSRNTENIQLTSNE